MGFWHIYMGIHGGGPAAGLSPGKVYLQFDIAEVVL